MHELAASASASLSRSTVPRNTSAAFNECPVDIGSLPRVNSNSGATLPPPPLPSRASIPLAKPLTAVDVNSSDAHRRELAAAVAAVAAAPSKPAPVTTTQDASIDSLIRKLQNSAVAKGLPPPPQPPTNGEPGTSASASAGSMPPPAVPPKPKMRAAGLRFQIPSASDANSNPQPTSSVAFETTSSSVVSAHPPVSIEVNCAAQRVATNTNGGQPEDESSSEEESAEFIPNKEINEEEVSLTPHFEL